MHQRFIAMQEEDPFVLEYMNLLGHREFGKGLQWLQVGDKPFQPNYPTTEIECWLEYWIYLHESIIEGKPNVLRMVDFDAIRFDPVVNLKPLMKFCGINCRYEQLAKMISRENTVKTNHNHLKSQGLLDTASRLKWQMVGNRKNEISSL
jgi:hypothetical protein